METSLLSVGTNGVLTAPKTVPTYALLPNTPATIESRGFLCSGWDAIAPRFIMTALYKEMLDYLAEGRRVNILITTDWALIDDLMIPVNFATKRAAAKSRKPPALWYYTWDAVLGNFRKTRVL